MRNHNSLSEMIFGETIQDPMFGRVVLNQGSSQRYWTSEAVFAPTQSKVTLFFSNLEGFIPTEVEAFYVEIESRYEDLRDAIEECLHKEYCRDISEISRDDVWDIFELRFITLPSPDEISKKEANWVLDYTYDLKGPSKVFNVEFLNWEIVECHSGESSQ